MDQELTLFGVMEKEFDHHTKLYKYIKQELEFNNLPPFDEWKKTVQIINRGDKIQFWFKNDRDMEFSVMFKKGEWYE